MLLSCEEVEKKLLTRQRRQQAFAKVMLKGLEHLCNILQQDVDPETHCLNNQCDYMEDYRPLKDENIAVQIWQDSWNGISQLFGLSLWGGGFPRVSVCASFDKENLTVEEVRDALRLKILNELKLKFKPEDLGPWWDKMYRVQTAMNELRQANTKCYQENGWAPLVDFEFEYRNPR